MITVPVDYSWCLKTEIATYCGAGWRHLIEDMLAGFDDLLWDQPSMTVDFLWIGEERGILKITMRFAGDSDEAYDAIGNMSGLFIGLSKKTCEVCGAPGRRRKREVRCKVWIGIVR
jgi:hypothetical protein